MNRASALKSLSRLERKADLLGRRLEPFYALAGWTWAMEGGSRCGDGWDGVPQARHIADTIRKLIGALRASFNEGEFDGDDQADAYTSTGGLEISVHESETKYVEAELRWAPEFCMPAVGKAYGSPVFERQCGEKRAKKEGVTA